MEQELSETNTRSKEETGLLASPEDVISERSERDEDELQFRASQITENPKQFIELMRTFACEF